MKVKIDIDIEYFPGLGITPDSIADEIVKMIDGAVVLPDQNGDEVPHVISSIGYEVAADEWGEVR